MITAKNANEIAKKSLEQRLYEEKELKSIEAIIKERAKQGAYWITVDANISENNIRVLQNLGYVVEKVKPNPLFEMSNTTRISWYLEED